MTENDEKREIIRRDPNFLEYPLWFQDEKMATTTEGYVWKDARGYTFRAGYRPPTRKDFLYLMYFIMRAQKRGRPPILDGLTRAEVLKACGTQKCAPEYERLEDSLKRWMHVGIEFSGTFYDRKDYHSMNFGIIDSWWIDKKTKKLSIRFNPEWYLFERSSEFFQTIEFNDLVKLSDPLTTRLYEILKKNLSIRSQWQIDSVKLAEKIPMDKKYPSDINPRIKAAINRISAHTEIKIGLEILKLSRGKTTLQFTLLGARPKQQELFPDYKTQEGASCLVDGKKIVFDTRTKIKFRNLIYCYPGAGDCYFLCHDTVDERQRYVTLQTMYDALNDGSAVVIV